MTDQMAEAAKAKETEMIRKLAARLPRESVARKCAEAILTGSPIESEWPAELCKMLPPKQTPDDYDPIVAAWSLGRIPLADDHAKVAVEVLVKTVTMGSTSSRKSSRRYLTWVLIVTSGYFVLLCAALLSRILPPNPQYLPAILYAICIWLGLWTYNQLRLLRVTGIRSIGLISDPSACAALAANEKHPYATVREAAQAALDSCIAAIRASHYGNLPPEVIPTLCKLLKTAGPDRKLAILQALAYAGDGRAVEAVRPLTEDPLSDRIRDLALRVLPILEARKVQETAAATLLRPSSLQDEPSQVLLRPASGVGAVPEEQLLRPAAPSEEVHVDANR